MNISKKDINTLFAYLSVLSILINVIILIIYIVFKLSNIKINIIVSYVLSFTTQYILMYIIAKVFYHDYNIKNDFKCCSKNCILDILLCFIFIFSFSIILTFIFNLFNIPLVQSVNIQDIPLFWAIIIGVVAAPTIEEVLFRGLIFDCLKTNGVYEAIIISSLAFGMLHGTLIQLISASLLGVILCLLKIKYKSLVPCIILHMLNNAAAVIDSSFVNDILIAFLLILSVIIIIFFLIRYKDILKKLLISSKKSILSLFRSIWFYVYLIFTIINIVLTIL